MTFDKVKEILVENLGVSEEEVKMESDIQEDLGADSLDIVEIVMAIEEEFGVSIPEDQIQNVKTVKNIVDYVNKNK